MSHGNRGYLEADYEAAFLSQLGAAGWLCGAGCELERDLSEPLLLGDLRTHLTTRYRALGSQGLQNALSRLREANSPDFAQALRSTHQLIAGGCNVDREAGQPALNVQYIDYDHPERNTFRALQQYTVTYGPEARDRRIPDIVLFVNGLPLCVVELKNPADGSATVAQAREQICVRYVRDIPHLLRYAPQSVIADAANARLGTPLTCFTHFAAWKMVNCDDRPSDLNPTGTLIRGALTPERLLTLYRDYLYFSDSTSPRPPVVARYPQFFGTLKLRESILRAQCGAESMHGHKGGVYFGATGCGKTLTMLFLSRQLRLRCRGTLGDPTIVLLVDREDLQNQAASLFCSAQDFLSCQEVRSIESRADLAQRLGDRQAGGFYICTVQKFTEGTGLINARRNIICLSDEAHRTQTNLVDQVRFCGPSKANPGVTIQRGFAQHLREALPGATYVGFSGTPDEDTTNAFGPIVAKYSMRQAVADGLTVPIVYEPRLARLSLDDKLAADIESYYATCAQEGADSAAVERSKVAMSQMEVLLANPQRLRRLAEDIATHFEALRSSKPALPQKALVTCANRSIAYSLYRQLASLRPAWVQPPDESGTPAKDSFLGIICTRGSNDEKEMYNLLGDAKHRSELARLFKRPETPLSLAIVVDMWITGFDAPCLSALYNDKPLANANLIQTISRVNRPFSQRTAGGQTVRKECGLVVDYIGVRENMLRALGQYGGDGDGGAYGGDLSTALQILRQELSTLRSMMEASELSGFFSDKPMMRLSALERGREFILSHPPAGDGMSFRSQFNTHAERLRRAYDICSPSGQLDPLPGGENDWCLCMLGLAALLSKVAREGFDLAAMNSHVSEMLRAALSCESVEAVIETSAESEEIFSAEVQREIEAQQMPRTRFELLAQALRRQIHEFAATNAQAARRYDEMLDAIVRHYNERADHLPPEAFDELTALHGELVEERAAFQRLGISGEQKAYYDILLAARSAEGLVLSEAQLLCLSAEVLALTADALRSSCWLQSDRQQSELRSSVCDLLLGAGFSPAAAKDAARCVFEQVCVSLRAA